MILLLEWKALPKENLRRDMFLTAVYNYPVTTLTVMTYTTQSSTALHLQTKRMNMNEITHAIRGLFANSIGVYAADHIPSRLSHPSAIAANLDTSEKPSSDWVAFYRDDHARSTFFDNYGLTPLSRHHLDRFRRNCKWIKWNKKKQQIYEYIHFDL